MLIYFNISNFKLSEVIFCVFIYLCVKFKFMFGIGGSELIFIMIIAVMLFGADKIPEIARMVGKGMAQLKNATEDIKSEINKSAQDSGLDMNSLKNDVSNEIKDVKQDFNKIISDNNPINTDVTNDLDILKTSIDDIVDGPIKRK